MGLYTTVTPSNAEASKFELPLSKSTSSFGQLLLLAQPNHSHQFPEQALPNLPEGQELMQGYQPKQPLRLPIWPLQFFQNPLNPALQRV